MKQFRLSAYIGADIGELLRLHPFSEWEVLKSIDDAPPKRELWYEFEGHGVDVICDEGGRIRTIFLHRGGGEDLSEVPFSLSRQEVLELFGAPVSSGGPVRTSVLGNSGAWDRFSQAGIVVHFQYRLDSDAIEMITLMSQEAVPC